MLESMENGSEALFTPGGVSMKPMLRNGRDTVALVKPKFPLHLYDLPLYRRENGTLVLHRIVAVKGNSYVMRGDNTYEDEPGITEKQILAVVRRFKRGRHWHLVTSPIYRLYAVLWVRFYPLRRFCWRGYHFVRRSFRFLKRHVLKI